MSGEQAKYHCALPGFDRRWWTGERLYQIHMGAPPDYTGEGERPDWDRPNENIADDGCPGAWYRTAFVESLLRYRRRPCEGGGRVSNPLLDRCDDEWIVEAVAELERWEDAWASEHIDAVIARARKEGDANGR